MENTRSTTVGDRLFGPVGSIGGSGFELPFPLEQIWQNQGV